MEKGLRAAPALGCARGRPGGCAGTSWLEEAGASGSGLSHTISQLSGLEAAGLPVERRMLPAPPARVRRTPCTSGLALDLPGTSGFCFILPVVRKPDTQQALQTSGPAEAAAAAPHWRRSQLVRTALDKPQSPGPGGHGPLGGSMNEVRAPRRLSLPPGLAVKQSFVSFW